MIHKAVQDIYLLDPENRRLSNLFLPKKLDRYLSKWVGRGVYSAIFDNVEDSLSLSRVQCFDFQGVNNAAICRPDRAADGMAATAHQRCAL